MTRTDDLAGRAEDERGGRERRTAAAAALSRYARSGGTVPAAIARALSAKRIDGTTIPRAEKSTEDERPSGAGLLAILAGRGRRDPGAPLEGHTPEASAWEPQSTYGFTPEND